MSTKTVDTPYGPARAQLHAASEGAACLLLGHGAGGGPEAADLLTVTRAAQRAGVHVALVEQPYRVAGKRAPAPAKQLDEAWLTVAAELSKTWFAGLPLVFGGRSSGARVACRTAVQGQATAVLCLAFPLLPPQHRHNPAKSRMPELSGVGVPTLVVQGSRDRFGVPTGDFHHELAVLRGDHSLDSDPDGLARVSDEWLRRVLFTSG